MKLLRKLKNITMSERKILANWIMAPDGTMIPSFHRHDYREYEGVMNDGGTAYLRRGGSYSEMTVYDDDPFEVIRRFYCRLNKGKDGNQPGKWVPLFRMDTDWLEAVIEYHIKFGLEKFNKYYEMELEYRKNKQ